DTTPVNTALSAPVVTVSPEKVKSDSPSPVKVSWEPVDNAASYSVMFSGKTYDVEECSYEIPLDIIRFLDAGAYQVSVFANPSQNDIYNTQSAAGTASFAVQAASSEGSSEFVVNTVDDLLNAIASGKTNITLANTADAHVITDLALTTPLHLKGQIVDGTMTKVKANFSISGEIGGSIIFENLDFDGTDVASSLLTEKKDTPAVVADTIAFIGCRYHDATKALYDNSGKLAACVQWLIFDNMVVENASYGSDMIDLRNGHYHNVVITNSTFANSARTFIRTDAGSEINNVLVKNNTFYKVATNNESKDNNGIFHIRSTGGLGMQSYVIMNNMFYSIPVKVKPSTTNGNGYPMFISKNAAALKPTTIRNNYFYNIEEEFEDCLWWTVNCSREEGIAGGGAVCAADPMKNAEAGDYTLVSGVAMNANVGDPRWNPMAGSTPTSEIAVDNVADLLTAINAGKKTITLKSGTYDLNSVTDNADVASGKLTLKNPLNIVGESGAKLIGSFVLSGENVTKFTVSDLEIEGIGDYLITLASNASVGPVELKNVNVFKTGGLIYAAKNASITVTSLEMTGCFFDEVGSKDFVDLRDGSSISAVKVVNNTFANGIRTFLRIDASVADLSSVLVRNNTFYNNCYFDSKDNNGIFHVRSTALFEANYLVQNNLFACMHKLEGAPSGNTNGYPKLVSTNTASKIPTFTKNYYYDVEEGDYPWWTKDRIDMATATAGYGVVLTENPFKDAANGDFTLVSALASSERIGDQRWNGGRPQTGDAFAVSNVDELLVAISAGKTSLELAYGTYDLTSSAELTEGKLTLNQSLALTGVAKDGKYPEVIGAFVLAAGEGASFSANKLSFNGNNTVSDFILMNANSDYSSITLRNCNISSYKNRLFSQPDDKKSETTINSGKIEFSGLYVSNMGTGGDCIDLRKGSASYLKVSNSTFCNGIRTVIRMDAAVKCGSVLVKNNTFYNLCSADSKDNNGILHVRASGTTIVEKNIFASMHKIDGAPTDSNKNGFPKLVSKASSTVEKAVREFRENLYFDIEAEGDYNWWAYCTMETGTANGGAVLSETPFAADPSTGMFTVKSEYKGYGALRW
ncbi:MAG: DUF5123 domain-containing protein, partial [Phocaeicola sp.]